MLLLQSLNDAGLTAVPVMLRMRDQGVLTTDFPALRKYTTFIVAVVLPQGNLYLDASSVNGGFNALAALLQADKARLVLKDKKGQWVSLQQSAKK